MHGRRDQANDRDPPQSHQTASFVENNVFLSNKKNIFYYIFLNVEFFFSTRKAYFNSVTLNNQNTFF